MDVLCSARRGGTHFTCGQNVEGDVAETGSTACLAEHTGTLALNHHPEHHLVAKIHLVEIAEVRGRLKPAARVRLDEAVVSNDLIVEATRAMATRVPLVQPERN